LLITLFLLTTPAAVAMGAAADSLVLLPAKLGLPASISWFCHCFQVCSCCCQSAVAGKAVSVCLRCRSKPRYSRRSA
jgi:hypothetical protein